MTTTMDPNPPRAADSGTRPETTVKGPVKAMVTAMPMSFDELYRGRYRSMVRLAYVLVDTSEDAEQVVQDAFIGLYKRFDRVDHPEAYLRTSVVNGARKMLRRRRIVRRNPENPAPDAELPFNHAFDAIRRLPAQQRELVALRYEQQMTDTEIAAALSMPIGTVKSRLHRAITTLRQELS